MARSHERTISAGEAEDAHPSLDASLEDFEINESRHSPLPLSLPLCPLPSSDQSDFLESGSTMSSKRSEAEDNEPWRPPYAIHLHSYRQLRPDSPPPFKRSRTGSPVRTESPLSNCHGVDEDLTLQATRLLRSDDGELPSTTRLSSKRPVEETGEGEEPKASEPEVSDDYPEKQTFETRPSDHTSFALSGEFKHSSELARMLNSWIRFLRRRPILVMIMLATVISYRWLLPRANHMDLNLPNLHLATRLTEQFEPILYYSTQGQYHVLELQESSSAVWDLSERVRVTNMISAPRLVEELDGLSEDLKTLSAEMTNFFATVNGDVDNILHTMDWAKTRLIQLQKGTGNPITVLWDTVHSIGSYYHFINDTSGGSSGLYYWVGKPNRRYREDEIHRLFIHYLNALEEGIDSELRYSVALSQLLLAVERRFQNIRRSVHRENNQQMHEESQMLDSLWTRLMGPNSASLRKFERNKQVLNQLSDRTVDHKKKINAHLLQLGTMKSSLEDVRKRLASPLLRSNDTNFDGLPAQIETIGRTHDHIYGVRAKAKSSMMYMLYDVRSQAGVKPIRGLHLSGDRGIEGHGIEGS